MTSPAPGIIIQLIKHKGAEEEEYRPRKAQRGAVSVQGFVSGIGKVALEPQTEQTAFAGV